MTCGYLLIWGKSRVFVCLQPSTHCRLTRRIFSRSSGASFEVPTWISKSRKVAIWTLMSKITCKNREFQLCNAQRPVDIDKENAFYAWFTTKRRKRTITCKNFSWPKIDYVVQFAIVLESASGNTNETVLFTILSIYALYNIKGAPKWKHSYL